MKRLPFRVEMARAWHEGRKTVTRRIVKPQPCEYEYGIFWAKDALSPRFPVEEIWRFAPYAPGSTVIIAEPLVNIGGIVAYAADRSFVTAEGHVTLPASWKWKVNHLSGRYMPNWAARSWGRVLSVRVERLQEITEKDAVLEGVDCEVADQTIIYRDYSRRGSWFQDWTEDEENYVPTGEIARASYRSLIDHINGPGTWDSNPWVFRYELERLTQNPAVAA